MIKEGNKGYCFKLTLTSYVAIDLFLRKKEDGKDADYNDGKLLS